MMFRKGIKPLSCLLVLSMPLLMVMIRIWRSGFSRILLCPYDTNPFGSVSENRYHEQRNCKGKNSRKPENPALGSPEKQQACLHQMHPPKYPAALFFSILSFVPKAFSSATDRRPENNRGDKNSGTRYNPVIESFRNKAHQTDDGQHGSIDGKESDEHLFVYFKFLLFAASKFNKRISGRRNVIIISQIPDISSGIHPL